MKTVTMEEVLSILDKAKTVAICSHVNPDGDALGSSLALATLLRARGCEVTCLLAQEQPAPGLYAFLDDYSFVSASSYTETPDLFIALDVPKAARLGGGNAVLERSPHSLCIDHHPDYDGFSESYFGNSSAAATSSIVWSIIKASGVPVTKAMADFCYIGLMTDTGCFSFQNTDEQAFRDAADMVAHGVDPSFLSMMVYESKSMNLLELESRLINRIRFSPNKMIVYSWVNEQDFRELGISRDDTEGLPTILRSIAGAEVSLLLRQEKGSVRANMRSRGSLDVGALARSFGGGGHKAASGATFKSSLDETIKTLLAAIENLENYKQACAEISAEVSAEACADACADASVERS